MIEQCPYCGHEIYDRIIRTPDGVSRCADCMGDVRTETLELLGLA